MSSAARWYQNADYQAQRRAVRASRPDAAWHPYGGHTLEDRHCRNESLTGIEVRRIQVEKGSAVQTRFPDLPYPVDSIRQLPICDPPRLTNRR